MCKYPTGRAERSYRLSEQAAPVLLPATARRTPLERPDCTACSAFAAENTEKTAPAAGLQATELLG